MHAAMTPFFESFVFGAANSVHCACMCGPLAMGFGGSAASIATYQGGRALTYTAIGCALGGGGTVVGTAAIATPTAAVAFVLAAGIAVLALAGERGALRVPILVRVLGRAMALGRSMRPLPRAALMGSLTPLLPCGLLWSACAGAAVAGSAVAGGIVMAGFAMGSLPLLFVAQSRAPALARRFSPHVLAFVQRAAMLCAAGVLVWRGLAAMHGGCCH